jgi:hypothetical protein
MLGRFSRRKALLHLHQSRDLSATAASRLAPTVDSMWLSKVFPNFPQINADNVVTYPLKLD